MEGVYRTVDILNIGTLDVIITASSEETYITYYVDSMDGNDANDGKTPQTAWRTLSRVNHMELKPGTRILFKAGSIFNGYLAPVGNGEAGRKIVFDRYGSGPAPIINGTAPNRCSAAQYELCGIAECGDNQLFRCYRPALRRPDTGRR